MKETGKGIEGAAEAEIAKLRESIDRLYPSIEAVFVKARAEEAYHDESPIVDKIRSAIGAGFEIRGAFDQAASRNMSGRCSLRWSSVFAPKWRRVISIGSSML
ncbi:MAG: hypothetical protein ISN28_01960 [Ectothiorhodospiraceae bacterium AqS1]|nr:hypothetical protein [Ectothiorhodospiraceae bacterium AqS1]